jgi:hypothetical protein
MAGLIPFPFSFAALTLRRGPTNKVIHRLAFKATFRSTIKRRFRVAL